MSAQPDTRCRECGATFECPPVGICPWCASNKLTPYFAIPLPPRPSPPLTLTDEEKRQRPEYVRMLAENEEKRREVYRREDRYRDDRNCIPHNGGR